MNQVGGRFPSMSRRHRENYEFSGEVKYEALKRAEYKCSQCGVSQETVHLQAHHVLPISIAVNFYPHIVPQLIASLENLEVLCPACHEVADKESFRNHRTIALALELVTQMARVS